MKGKLSVRRSIRWSSSPKASLRSCRWMDFSEIIINAAARRFHSPCTYVSENKLWWDHKHMIRLLPINRSSQRTGDWSCLTSSTITVIQLEMNVSTAIYLLQVTGGLLSGSGWLPKWLCVRCNDWPVYHSTGKLSFSTAEFQRSSKSQTWLLYKRYLVQKAVDQ